MHLQALDLQALTHYLPVSCSRIVMLFWRLIPYDPS